MRPRNLDEFLGQNHVLGPGKLLRRLIESERISSLILYGPPGTGKTTVICEIIYKVLSEGKRVLLIDLDPHGSLTCYFGFDPDDIENSGYDLFHQTKYFD